MEKKIWPDTAKINPKGSLEIGGCDLLDLAKDYGTPLYLIDEKTLANRCCSYLSAFKQYHDNVEVIFASKALCVIGLSRLIAKAGLGFDVSSGGELYTVLRAGADPKRIYFHGNNKSLGEIEEALNAGIGRFMVDNRYEIDNIEKCAKRLKKAANITIRVNPGIEAHTHEFIQTGRIDSKFGVPLDQLSDFIQLVKSKKQLKLSGFHAHIGSQILDYKPYLEETKLLIGLIEKFGGEEINIGGGIGIPYQNDQTAPAFNDFAREICSLLKGKPAVKLILEPGRSIVGTAGVTLYTIGVVKDIPGIRKYLIVDGGMADNPRPILYGAKYTAMIVNKTEGLELEKVTVGGRYCESGDILLKDIELPRAESGDILAVASTGAYNYSMASNYNRVPRPAMVLVSHGQASLLVKRESYEDLVANDTI